MFYKPVTHVLFDMDGLILSVENLLRHLDKHKIPMGPATSSSRETYNLKVTHHQNIFEMFPYKTWGSSDPDVKRGKPSPDIFLIAVSKFPAKPSPNKCFVFEDSINGVKSAVSAGMQVLMVPGPRLNRDLALKATLILNSMEDFRPKIFGLPPFDN